MLKSDIKTTHIFGVLWLYFFCFSTQAITFTHNPNATSSCYYNLPELAPLSVPRTLVVDNNLPNGTVLYSWGYNEFIPNINSYCTGLPVSSTLPSTILFFYPAGQHAFSGGSNGAYPTRIPGIGIKFYFTYTARGASARSTTLNTSAAQANGSILSPSEPLNVEYTLLYNIMFPPVGVEFRSDIISSNPLSYSYSQQANHINYSIRAELIKIGTIPYSSTLLSSPLFMNNPPSVRVNNSYTSVSNVIGGGGIRIVPPSCQLKSSTDYSINMGRWLHSGPNTLQPGISLPAYGPTKPINISLECSSKLNNVYFRFEDTGTVKLSNKNISLYDDNGTKIDGIEIEMLYNGSRINVDNSTKTNVGSQGTLNTNPAEITFNSQSTIPFTARYVQRSAIQKGGVSYTGSVTGKVNMYVTYQ
ncbi:fimbrial protein [Leminorella grimontii]|uniref:fimbrial protein n=1 Tax=Leminorella grimontii TaxID=82981 RepID=UPI0032200AE8